MQRVGLFPVGYLAADIPRLCRFLNSAQSHYNFSRATAIQNIGDPDLSGYGYSDVALATLVAPHKADYDYSILVTPVPLERNYFASIVNLEVVVLTTFEAEGLVAAARKSIEQGIAIGLCATLVALEFQRVTENDWTTLFHQDHRGCLFDFTGYKPHAIAKLVTCKICDSCKGNLAGTNINSRVLRAIERILRRIRRPSVREAITSCFRSPVRSFVYGGILFAAVINLVTSVAMAAAPLTGGQLLFIWLLGSAVVLFPLAVYGFEWFKYWRSRIRE